MKARIKETGEVLDVVDILLRAENGGADVFCIEDVEIINETPTAELCSTEPDWEGRRWQAAVAAMQAQLSLQPTPSPTEAVEYAVYVADLLISELKKQKP